MNRNLLAASFFILVVILNVAWLGLIGSLVVAGLYFLCTGQFILA